MIVSAWLLIGFIESSVAIQRNSNINPEIVVSQIFGGGGSSANGFKNDFVELFNRGSATTSLVGWSLQYAPANS
ncbi:MAG: hypothetical protein AAB401_04805, partial [Acidobacteriota bacterium]